MVTVDLTPLEPEGASRQGRTVRPFALTIVAVIAIAIMAFSIFYDIVRRPDAALVKSDFAAFYCGSVVSLAHQDPYALTPLRQCEARRVDIPGGVDPALFGIDPDPLPGYNMAVFAPFTLLPYRAAALIWDGVLLAAIAGTAALLVALTGVPFIAIVAILAFSDGGLSIPYGQLSPVLLFGLVLAAYGLVRERRALVLIGATLVMIEPHVGLPAVCALFVWRPALRWGLVAVALGFVALSIAALGVPLNVEYALVVLPTHAAAEATTSIQYSLSWLLHYLGLPDTIAIRVASWQYAGFVAVAIALAGALARKLESAGAIVLYPAAIAVVGGPFIHAQQIVAALPLALLLATRLRGPAAATAWTAVALLAVPWDVNSRLTLLAMSAIIVTIVVAALPRQRAFVIAGAAVASILLCGAISGPVMTRLVPNAPRHLLAPTASLPHALDGDLLASGEDARKVRSSDDFAVATPRTLAIKLPTWIALCALAVLSVGILRRDGTLHKNDIRSNDARSNSAQHQVHQTTRCRHRVSRQLMRAALCLRSCAQRFAPAHARSDSALAHARGALQQLMRAALYKF